MCGMCGCMCGLVRLYVGGPVWSSIYLTKVVPCASPNLLWGVQGTVGEEVSFVLFIHLELDGSIVCRGRFGRAGCFFALAV